MNVPGRVSPTRSVGVPSAPSVLAWGRKIVLNNTKQHQPQQQLQPQQHQPQQQQQLQPQQTQQLVPSVHTAQHGFETGRAPPVSQWQNDPVVAGAMAATAAFHPNIETELSTIAASKDDVTTLHSHHTQQQVPQEQFHHYQHHQHHQPSYLRSTSPVRQTAQQPTQPAPQAQPQPGMHTALQLLQSRLDGTDMPSDLIGENERLKKTLETVVRDLHETEQELDQTKRELRGRNQKYMELEDENSSLAKTVHALTEIKQRMTTDLHVAAEKLEQHNGKNNTINNKIECMERDELLAGTVVVRLSEHITAVEEVTIQSRKSLEGLVKDLYSLMYEVTMAKKQLNDPLKTQQAEIAQVTLPPSDDVDDQYRALKKMIELAHEAFADLKSEWAPYKTNTLDISSSYAMAREDLARRQKAVSDMQNRVNEVTEQRRGLETQLSEKTEELACVQDKVAKATNAVREMESKLLGMIRQGEQEVGQLKVKVETLQSESQDLRRKAVDAHTEITRLTEARERAETALEREVQEQHRLTEELKRNMAAKDDKEGTVLTLEKELRSLRVNDDRFTSEINKLHTIRIEKERQINSLTEQCNEIEDAMNTLQGEHAAVQAEHTEAMKNLRHRERELQTKCRELTEVKNQSEVLTDELKSVITMNDGLAADLKKATENEKRAGKEANYFRSILLNRDGKGVASEPVSPPPEPVSKHTSASAYYHTHANGGVVNANANALRRTSPPRPTPSKATPLQQFKDNSMDVSSIMRNQTQPAYQPTPEHDDSIIDISGVRTDSPPRMGPTTLQQHWTPPKETGVSGPASASGPAPVSDGSYQSHLHGVAERLRNMMKTDENDLTPFLLSDAPSWPPKSQWPAYP